MVNERQADAIERAKQMELEPPKRKLSPVFDPRTFDHHVGIDEETNDDLALGKARKAYARYGEKLSDWQKRERVIYANKYEPRIKKKMMASKMVKDELEKGVKIIDDARHTAKEEIDGIDREINRGFLSRQPEAKAQEIRQYMRDLKDKERRKLLQEGDLDVLSAVLTAKPFLSGLTPGDAIQARREATQRLFPEEVKRRAKLEKSLEMLDKVNDAYWQEVPEMIDKEVKTFEEQAEATKQAIRGSRTA